MDYLLKFIVFIVPKKGVLNGFYVYTLYLFTSLNLIITSMGSITPSKLYKVNSTGNITFFCYKLNKCDLIIRFRDGILAISQWVSTKILTSDRVKIHKNE